MDLGPLSMSLAVEDIQQSLDFYEKLGFEIVDRAANYGDDFPMAEGQDWLILRSGDVHLGLFQGMFDENLLTFHPESVREVQTILKERGVALDQETDPEGEGDACVILTDPDGNRILLDQS